MEYTLNIRGDNTLLLRTFLRFLREYKVLNRYKTDIAHYYLETWEWTHGPERKRFIECDFDISKFLCNRACYTLPIDKIMIWDDTRSGHRFWNHVNSKWEHYWCGLNTLEWAKNLTP